MEEKIKLAKLTSNAWHYRLIKFIWGNTLPDPKTIHNFCLYFWVLIATAIISLVILPIKLIAWANGVILDRVTDYLERKIEKLSDDWFNNLSDDGAYQIHKTYYAHHYVRSEYNSDYTPDAKIPKKLSGRYTASEIIAKWAKKKGLDITSPEYQTRLNEVMEQLRVEAELKQKKDYEIKEKQRELDRKRRIKAEARDKKIRERMDKIASIFKPLKKLKPNFQIKNYAQVAKLGKRLLGVILTGVVTVATYFVIQFVTLFFMWIAQIWNGHQALIVLETIGLLILGVGVITLLCIGIRYFVIWVKENYVDENKVPWFVKPFIWVAYGIFYVGKYTLYYPGYFIFVSFLWKLICVNILWSIIKGFAVAIMKFGGIFGEYFGTTYTDYCPGISWDNEETEK